MKKFIALIKYREKDRGKIVGHKMAPTWMFLVEAIEGLVLTILFIYIGRPFSYFTMIPSFLLGMSAGAFILRIREFNKLSKNKKIWPK